MGLSENRVYSQWNSHLIGIMISKTIGFRVHYFQTHPNLNPDGWRLRACHSSLPGMTIWKMISSWNEDAKTSEIICEWFDILGWLAQLRTKTFSIKLYLRSCIYKYIYIYNYIYIIIYIIIYNYIYNYIYAELVKHRKQLQSMPEQSGTMTPAWRS